MITRVESKSTLARSESPFAHLFSRPGGLRYQSGFGAHTRSLPACVIVYNAFSNASLPREPSLSPVLALGFRQ
jgi:hypothetical protein